jgi:asparagine synthase (glutamine-hydrolysing)
MCGIAGALNPGGTARPVEAREAELLRMLGLLAHRGPDGAGVRLDPFAAIGAVRLRIVDPAGGAQPMSDATERWWIAYNGEVYNFPELRAELEAAGCRFRTRCDTEVVLQAWIRWGERSVERFDGGFAFALYDRVERTVHLVRDRFGKRPLFYCRAGGTWLFASEMKAFLACPAWSFAWNPETVADAFAHWTTVDGDTPFQGVDQVKSGTMLRISADGLRETRHGGFTPPQRSSPIAFEAASRRAADLLREAVRRRLRGDAEPTVMLSGGLDSAIVAHLMREERGAPLRAYSIGFAAAEFDESGDQDRLAEHLGLDHVRIAVDDDAIAEAFGAAAWHAEALQFRTALAPMYILHRHVAACGTKVVLSGEGADEVFLGYDIFRETRLRANWQRLSTRERRTALQGLYPYLAYFSEENAAALERVFAHASEGPDALLFSHALRLDNGAFARRLLTANIAPHRLADAAAAAGLALLDPVTRAQWLEFVTLLQGYLLSSQGDRMSFAHGVESRMPFLSREVVDFAATLPEAYHLSEEGCEKRLLKAAFAGALPAWLTAKPKQPYRAPGASAFRRTGGGLRPWVEALLAPEALAETGLIDPRMGERLVETIRSAARPATPRQEQAFILLLSLSLLHRAFVRGEGAGGCAVVPGDVRVVETVAA